jgi:hypothetical protein
MIEKNGLQLSGKQLIPLVFVFFLAINLVTGGGHLDTWDGIEAFLVTESMVLKHTAKLDPTVPSVNNLHFNVRYSVYSSKQNNAPPGKYFDQFKMPLEPVYTVRSLLISAIAVPFYYAALFFSAPPISVVGLFVNSLLISLTSLVIFCFSLEIYRSKKIAFALSLIFSVCSFVWPYQNSLWAMPLQALTLITAAFFIYKSIHPESPYLVRTKEYRQGLRTNRSKGIYFAGLGGLFLGLSVFAHPTSIILIPAFVIYSILYMRKNRRTLFSFLIALGITLSFMGLVNYWRFGSFSQFGYGYFSSLATHNGWRGLIGLLISPGAGLFIYFPTAILLPLAGKYMYKENKSLFLLFFYVIFANWIDVGTLSFNFEPFSWWGTGWGPRYLVAILPFITIILGSLLVHSTRRSILKISIIALSVAGFYINFVGTLVWWQYGIVYVSQQEHLWNKDPWNLIVWNPYYSPIVLHTKMLATDFISHINPERYINSGWNWIAYSLAPCSYDLYIFCKGGIAPVILLLAAIGVLGVIILREIGVFFRHPTKSVYNR